jgi:hypothetical protein
MKCKLAVFQLKQLSRGRHELFAPSARVINHLVSHGLYGKLPAWQSGLIGKGEGVREKERERERDTLSKISLAYLLLATPRLIQPCTYVTKGP